MSWISARRQTSSDDNPDIVAPSKVSGRCDDQPRDSATRCVRDDQHPGGHRDSFGRDRG